MVKFFAFLSIIALLSVTSAFVPETEWVCGAATFDRSLAFQRASEVCDDVGFDVNQCCVIHDKCYEEDKTQAECDDPFCACLEKQAYRANSTNCGAVLEGFCSMVRWFGGIAHAGAKSKADATTTTTTAAPEVSIEACFNENLQSCVRDFETCPARPGLDIHQCEEQMCACTQASLRDDAPQQCRKTVDRVCAAPSNHGFPLPPKAEETSVIFTVSVIVFIAATAIILTLAIIVVWIGIRMHLRPERFVHFAHSPSTTPLCSAAVPSDFNLGYMPANSSDSFIAEDNAPAKVAFYP
uniref:EB domain-containing protein n=1 Tax=Panagrellus redivivus TaxID=6233 RepID=A0A7E4VM18_PANRE